MVVQQKGHLENPVLIQHEEKPARKPQSEVTSCSPGGLTYTQRGRAEEEEGGFPSSPRFSGSGSGPFIRSGTTDRYHL